MLSHSLLTDFYQLTMAQNYWDVGLAERQACFYASFRKAPFGGRFAVTAGIGTLLEILKNFQFSASDLDFLASMKNTTGKPIFKNTFLEKLKKFSLAVSLDAMPEGEIAFADEPLLRVTGPLWQAQLLETIILNTLNFQTLIATKTARICLAAKTKPIMEFGLRRAHGVDGALSASRAAFIGGCASTSNVLASKIFDIPASGTQAHSWVMSFNEELESFSAFAENFPDDYVLLVDTYNSTQGIDHAIETAKKFPQKKLKAIRLDSGDLAHLSKIARAKLDSAGFKETLIFASNDLDETIITGLEQEKAKIDGYGVGTKLVTGYPQGALGAVYKLSALQNTQGQWQNKIKLSEQIEKISNPGLLNVKRFFVDNIARYDVIYDENTGFQEDKYFMDPRDPTHQFKNIPQAQEKILLKNFICAGKFVSALPSIHEIQQVVKINLQHFHPAILRFLNPHYYPVGLDNALYNKKLELIRQLRTL